MEPELETGAKWERTRARALVTATGHRHTCPSQACRSPSHHCLQAGKAVPIPQMGRGRLAAMEALAHSHTLGREGTRDSDPGLTDCKGHVPPAEELSPLHGEPRVAPDSSSKA